MKGAGEGFFEMDFPPGSDMTGQTMSCPRAAKRMEFELFTRLKHRRLALEARVGCPVMFNLTRVGLGKREAGTDK